MSSGVRPNRCARELCGSVGETRKMKILTFNPSRRLALVLHSIFASIYLLLGTRAVISLNEGPPDSSTLTENSPVVVIVKRVSGILYQPFFWVFVPASVGNADLIEAIVFAIAFYALIHYGMLMNVPNHGSVSMADKILKMCRAIFFLAGTLLLLLIVARMSVMLYQDIHLGRLQFGIASPAKK